MASEIRTLKDGETQVLPRTKAKAVSTEDGSTVENKLNSVKPIQFTTESIPLQFTQDQIESIVAYSPLIILPYTYEDPAVGAGPEPDPTTYNAVFVPYLKDEGTITYISHLDKRNIMLKINTSSMVGEIEEVGASFLPDPDYYDRGKYVAVDDYGLNYVLKDIEIPSSFNSNITISNTSPSILFIDSSTISPRPSASISFVRSIIKGDGGAVSTYSDRNSISVPHLSIGSGFSGYAICCNDGKINGVGDPQYESDAANKKYVDSLIGDIGSLLDTINGEVI